jgi:hypothetical protein
MRFALFCPVVALASLFSAAFAATPLTQDPLTALRPADDLVRFAAAAAVPLQGIALAPNAAAAGTDGVTMLLELHKGREVRQWIVRVQTARLTEAERAKPAPAPAPLVIHMSTGRTFTYGYTAQPLVVEFMGPFAVGGEAARPAPEVKHAVVTVNGEYLRQGMAAYCASAVEIKRRMQEAGIKNFIYFGGSGPMSAEGIAKSKQSMGTFVLTEAEDRLAFSIYLALTTFFDAAGRVPACQAVLTEVVDLPSLWSILRHVGVRMDFNYSWSESAVVDSPPAGVPGPMYTLPVTVMLNGRPGVKATIAVVPPNPPLEACAGIYAMCIEHPADASRRLFLRVLAARRTP